MRTGRTAPLAALAAVLAFPSAATALESGVQADPGSPAGKEYAFPLAASRGGSSGGGGKSTGSGSHRSANRESSQSSGAGGGSGGGGGSGDGTGESGGGTTAQTGGAPTDGSTTAHNAPAPKTATRPFSDAGSSSRVVSDEQLARAEHQSWFPGPLAIGLLVTLLLAASLLATVLLARRRQVHSEGQPGPLG